MGIKAGGQTNIGMRDRAGLQLDARRTDVRFNNGYDGWQVGLYSSFEHALSRSLVGAVGAFVRRDWLKEAAYSSTELGVTAGFGGELPYGLNFGLTGSASRARFDAPMLFFSSDPRADWRFTGRATLGNRKVRVFGFSPELSLTYARTDSTLPLYSTDRLRFRVALARYF
jgi:outer membrane protein